MESSKGPRSCACLEQEQGVGTRIDRGLSRNQVRQDVSIHEREKVFEINGEDGSWVGKGQTGKGKIKKGIKR